MGQDLSFGLRISTIESSITCAGDQSFQVKSCLKTVKCVDKCSDTTNYKNMCFEIMSLFVKHCGALAQFLTFLSPKMCKRSILVNFYR